MGKWDMAKPRLSLMSTEALLKLRADVDRFLGQKTNKLRTELARLTGKQAPGRRAGRSVLKGRKVAPKYSDKSGNVWSGRGVQPKWMTAAIAAGAKKDDFLIAQPKGRKKTRPRA